jgi:site-specific DNA recombinase
MRRLSGELATCDDAGSAIARLADLQERIAMAERRLARVREQQQAIGRGIVREDEAALALSRFDPVWQALSPREQARVLNLLVERVEYDGGSGKVAVTFHPAGIRALSDELVNQSKEMSA